MKIRDLLLYNIRSIYLEGALIDAIFPKQKILYIVSELKKKYKSTMRVPLESIQSALHQINVISHQSVQYACELLKQDQYIIQEEQED